MEESSDYTGHVTKKSTLFAWISLFINSACLGYIWYFSQKIVIYYNPIFMQMRMELPKPTKFFLNAGIQLFENWYILFPLAAMLFVILPLIETTLKKTLLPDWCYIVISVLLILFALLMYASIMMPIIEIDKHLQRA